MDRRLVVLALLLGCGSPTEPPVGHVARPDLEGPLPYDRLSAYGFFVRSPDHPISVLSPAPGVVPYEVNAPLWSDGLEKARFIVLPEGGHATIADDGEWDLPIGSVLIKTFSDGERRLETRLLVREASGYKPHVYLWEEDQTDALKIVAGKRVVLTRGQTYLVPNTNQCGSCHERDDVSLSLGLVTRQMNRGLQLASLVEAGVLTALPEPSHLEAQPPLVDPYDDESGLTDRARSWLDANCSHCHREGGGGGPSGLVLLRDETVPSRYGVCKGAVAAGGATGDRLVDIWPGHPERSILVHRIESTEPDVKMPELPNLLPDPRGLKLIRDFIAALPEDDCGL